MALLGAVGWLPALATIGIALGISHLMASRLLSNNSHERVTTVDGLRGFLACFVFLHHSSIWYFHLHGEAWQPPPSRLYVHFGQTSVALFFMITAFLFHSKLLDARDRGGLDWLQLFSSRFLRLFPLYACMVVTLAGIVGIVSAGTLHDSPRQIAKGLAHWLFFTLQQMPDLNGVARTRDIIAGVTWSLRFEWMYYLALPLIGMLMGLRIPLFYLALSAVGTVYLGSWQPSMHYLHFLAGIAATYLARCSWFRIHVKGYFAGLLAVTCLSFTVGLLDSAYEPAAAMLLGTFFVIVAGGNDLFGLLSMRASRALGELTYGIYLFHGLILYSVFKLALGGWASGGLESSEHWAVIIAITPLLLTVAYLGHQWVERPAMLHLAPLVARLRSCGRFLHPMRSSR